MTTLSLETAVDVLAGAARAGGRPGSLWLVGLFYQGLSLGWTFGITVARPIALAVLPEGNRRFLSELSLPRWVSSLFDPIQWLRGAEGPARWVWMALLLCLLLAPFRLVAGMARLAPTDVRSRARIERRGPSFRHAWRAGHGLSRAALGLWVQILWMMFLAVLLFLGPCHALLSTLGLGESHPLRALLYGLSIAFIALYGFLLAVLFQLALHSLVQNRRGVGSAVLHAWRIVRNDPWATARATVVDGLLYAVVLAFQLGLMVIVGLAGDLAALAGVKGFAMVIGIPGFLLIFAFEAFAGCTRCSYWAHAYRALGGISTVERGSST